MRRIFIIVFFLSFMTNNMFSQQRPTLNREGIKKEINRRNKAKQAKASKENGQKDVAETKTKKTQNKGNVVKRKNTSAHLANSKRTPLSVSTTSLSVASEGASRYITVYGNSDWYIDEIPSWIYVSKSDNQLYVSVDKNNSTQSRSDYFTIRNGSETCIINISQSGASTKLNVSSSYVSFSSSGGSRTISVESDSYWYIDVEHAGWVHTNKSGNQLSISVDSNNSAQSRSDYFTINNGHKTCKINISQSGRSAYLNVSVSYISFSSSGGTRTIYVDSNCDWVISVATDAWSSMSRTEKSITLNVKANYSLDKRTDYFVIKGGGLERRVNITQAASYSSYNYSNSNHSNENKNIWDSDYKPSYSYNSNNSSESLFSIGIDGDIETDLGSDYGYKLFYSIGLLARLWKPKHTINFITGVKYRWYWDIPSNYGSKWRYYGGIIGVPANFRFNIVHFGDNDNAAMFIGLGAELGVYIADEKYKNCLEKNYTSLSLQFGFTSRHFDVLNYWRRYQKGPFAGTSDYDVIGLQIGLYF